LPPVLPAPVDHVDAPYMRAVEARIPVGNAVAIVPSFQSALEDEPVQEVRLGAAKVSGASGWIYQNGIWLMHFSWYGGQSFLPPSYQIPLAPDGPAAHTQTIRGSATSTVPTFSSVYGHVLHDELPLLLHLMDGGRFKRYETILCSQLAMRLMGRFDHPNRDQLLARARAARPDTSYQMTDFTALRRTGCRMNPSKQEIDLLRAHTPALHGVAGNGKCSMMYLMRASATRQIRNEGAVYEVLDRHKIARVAPRELSDPWGSFARADLIVGVSGSDLSDSVFMKRGAGLLEIHPSDHIKPYNWNIAGKLGLTYRSLVARSDIERRTPVGPGNSPITIDVDAFDQSLREVIEAVRPARPALADGRGYRSTTDLL
jgi:hypothetical protein